MGQVEFRSMFWHNCHSHTTLFVPPSVSWMQATDYESHICLPLSIPQMPSTMVYTSLRLWIVFPLGNGISHFWISHILLSLLPWILYLLLWKLHHHLQTTIYSLWEDALCLVVSQEHTFFRAHAFLFLHLFRFSQEFQNPTSQFLSKTRSAHLVDPLWNDFRDWEKKKTFS